ncbi:MAG TPA: hypothetical protein VNL96_08875 [Gemmatimonadaceae bacterium]|nr:hypothetical protein [Gemmatimonadaceae bacterium]
MTRDLYLFEAYGQMRGTAQLVVVQGIGCKLTAPVLYRPPLRRPDQGRTNASAPVLWLDVPALQEGDAVGGATFSIGSDIHLSEPYDAPGFRLGHENRSDMA